MASDPAPSFEVGRQVKPGSMVRTPPVWAVLTGPYALFLLFLLIVPLANVALFSIQRYFAEARRPAGADFRQLP